MFGVDTRPSLTQHDAAVRIFPVIKIQLLLTDKVHHRVVPLKIAWHVHDIMLDPVEIRSILRDNITFPQMLLRFRELTDAPAACRRDRGRDRHRILLAVQDARHLTDRVRMSLTDPSAPKRLILSARQYHLRDRAVQGK